MRNYYEAFEAAINCPIYINTYHTLMKFLYKLLLVKLMDEPHLQLAVVEMLLKKYLDCILHGFIYYQRNETLGIHKLIQSMMKMKLKDNQQFEAQQSQIRVYRNEGKQVSIETIDKHYNNICKLQQLD